MTGIRTWVALALAIGIATAGVARADPCCGPITPAGQRLAAALDASGVDHLWLAGYRIDWESGQPIGPGRPSSTHCSAYVAAIASRLGIYVLRPPAHAQTSLANAQLGWLNDQGGGAGWRSLPDAAAAQAAANRGELVLEAFANPNPHRPGHIAIVRPSEESAVTLARDGPREAQAGAMNARDTSTADGFAHHPGAWVPGGEGGIRYFAHPIDRARLP